MSLSGRLFALIYEPAMRASEKHGLADMRSALLAGARGRTLEVGAGTGLNLGRYPAGVTELVLCEPEEPMARRLRERATQHGAQVVAAPAEALPFPDASFDTVVSTLVLCTVTDPLASVREARRVLRPGGRLLFLEHVRSSDPAGARQQDRWDPVWRHVGHGCRCNRDTVATLRAGGFTVEDVQTTTIPKAAPIIRPAVSGVAVVLPSSDPSVASPSAPPVASPSAPPGDPRDDDDAPSGPAPVA